MLNFLATTENLRNIRSEQPNDNRGKVVKKSSGKLLLAISRYNIMCTFLFSRVGGGGILVVAFKL